MTAKYVFIKLHWNTKNKPLWAINVNKDLNLKAKAIGINLGAQGHVPPNNWLTAD